MLAEMATTVGGNYTYELPQGGDLPPCQDVYLWCRQGAKVSQRELFRISLDLILFGHKVAIIASVVDSESKPFLVSISQLEEWDAVIRVRDNIPTTNIGGQTIKYTAPCPTCWIWLGTSSWSLCRIVEALSWVGLNTLPT